MFRFLSLDQKPHGNWGDVTMKKKPFYDIKNCKRDTYTLFTPSVTVYYITSRSNII